MRSAGRPRLFLVALLVAGVLLAPAGASGQSRQELEQVRRLQSCPTEDRLAPLSQTWRIGYALISSQERAASVWVAYKSNAAGMASELQELARDLLKQIEKGALECTH